MHKKIKRMIMTLRSRSLFQVKPNANYSELDMWPELHRLDLGLFDMQGTPIKICTLYRQGIQIDPLMKEYEEYSKGKNTILEMISVFKEMLEKSTIVVMHNIYYNLGVLGSELKRRDIMLEKKLKYDVREKQDEPPYIYLTMNQLIEKYNIDASNEMDLLCKLYLVKNNQK